MRDIEGVFIFRIPEGKELVKEIEKFASENDIKCGGVMVIGALKNARIGYYDPKMKKYIEMDVDEQVELLSAIGNISLKEGKVFLHLHAVLGKRDFSVVGGHLIKGEVFVAEVIIQKFSGKLERKLDSTGLFLF